MSFWQNFSGLFSVFLSSQFQTALKVLWALFPFWGPPSFAFGFFLLFAQYTRAQFLSKQKHVLLEIRLPREVFKSPLAMELALTGFYVTSGESNWYDVYILGKVKPWFSLEIASFEGNVHFYIWTREGFRNIVEAQLYGQYPDIEIFEVPDYTRNVPNEIDYDKFLIVGQEYQLTAPDPFPIKTYVDYGLDKDPKEEFKIDPLTSVIEYLATLKKGEQIWLQFIIQAHKNKPKEGGPFSRFEKTDVHKEAKEEIKKIQESLKEKSVTDTEEGPRFGRIPTRAESDLMSAIDRHAGKLNFDTGIRLVYIAEKAAFQGVRISQTFAIFRPFATKNMNSIAFSWGPYFDYPWQDFRNLRSNFRRRELFQAYRLRSWFHPPIKRKPLIFSQEELATLYHFPGGVLQVPSIERVMSKKTDAPANLPT